MVNGLNKGQLTYLVIAKFHDMVYFIYKKKLIIN